MKTLLFDKSNFDLDFTDANHWSGYGDMEYGNSRLDGWGVLESLGFYGYSYLSIEGFYGQGAEYTNHEDFT